ncbi:hypothetical protein V6U90_03690 [Micromonospora sp. CPCC 206060]|uniref:hypothetical protein n=1 Tax=Micromonospora sp. CPCC 206060 TaxID=3122406 RepID=UPI002FF1C7F2
MSDNYPPYGPSDPNAGQQPWAPPPAQPAYGQPAYGQPTSGQPSYGQPTSGQPASGQPAYGQPGFDQPAGYPQQPGFPPPQFGTPVPPKKSSKGLVIGLSVGAAVVVLLALCGVGVAYVAGQDDEDPPTPIASGGPTATAPAEPGTSPSADNNEPDNNGNNNAVTARYSSDFEAVCQGSPILNSLPYTAGSGKAYTFYNSVDRPDNWSIRTVGYGKPYYAKSSDYTTVSVVGCLKYVDGSEGPGTKCNLKGSDDKVISIDYVSSRYELTFYAAKTAEKIGDGGTINAPANRCPSFVTYNKNTMKAYAAPDSGAIEAALDKFLA